MIVTKTFHFSASHIIYGHPKCGRLHGHNYRVDVSVQCRRKDMVDGMVIDFGDLKAIVDPIIEKLDHHHLIPLGRPDPIRHLPELESSIFIMEVQHTTAEEIALWIEDQVADQFSPDRIVEFKVDVWETPTSKASTGW